jgi:hypothetical protein
MRVNSLTLDETGTKVNYLEVSSSLDLMDVIVLRGIAYVGELYTFLSLNVIRVCGVSTNQRLRIGKFVPTPSFPKPGLLI